MLSIFLFAIMAGTSKDATIPIWQQTFLKRSALKTNCISDIALLSPCFLCWIVIFTSLCLYNTDCTCIFAEAISQFLFLSFFSTWSPLSSLSIVPDRMICFLVFFWFFFYSAVFIGVTVCIHIHWLGKPTCIGLPVGVWNLGIILAIYFYFLPLFNPADSWCEHGSSGLWFGLIWLTFVVCAWIRRLGQSPAR